MGNAIWCGTKNIKMWDKEHKCVSGMLAHTEVILTVFSTVVLLHSKWMCYDASKLHGFINPVQRE